MRLLALESSTLQCSVALWVDGALHERLAPMGTRNSETLLPLAAALLADTGSGFAGLDAIAFGAGPGAFTGLRVACGVAQGLAFARGLPVVPVGTLEVLAEGLRPLLPAGPALRVLAALDARMGECYWAELEQHEDDWLMARGPLLCRPAEVPLPPPGDWLLAGDGFTVHGAALAQRLGTIGRRLPDLPTLPAAGALARLAVVRLRAGRSVAAEAAQPLYVRDKVALTSAERRPVP